MKKFLEWLGLSGLFVANWTPAKAAHYTRVMHERQGLVTHYDWAPRRWKGQVS